MDWVKKDSVSLWWPGRVMGHAQGRVGYEEDPNPLLHIGGAGMLGKA
jgi:hypothetical protein